jgi:D-alanyl-D-alanine carboxypeptidase (penicillin-binding protein 5/6)
MPFEIQNTNELLGRDGIDGVKTGRTRRAGDCVILSADRPPESRREGEKVFVTPRRIIVVLLRSTDRFGEGLAYMQQGWSLYDAWAAQGRKTPRSRSL